METNNEADAIITDKQLAREKFEQERLTRRAALRKIGITSGMALFGMFAVDDLARIAIKKLEEHKETLAIGETVAREFKDSGIVFAGAIGGSSRPPCSDCAAGCVADDEYDCVDCDAAKCGTYSEFVDSEPAEYGWIDGLWKRIKKEIKKPLQKKVKKVLPCNGTDFYKSALEATPGDALNTCEASCKTCATQYHKDYPLGDSAKIANGCNDLCAKAHEAHTTG